MNPSTPQTQSQPTGQLLNTQPSQMMPPDQAAASLAFATNLSDQLMQHKQVKQQPKSSPETPKSAPSEEKQQDTGKDQSKELDALRTEFDKKLQDMKKGITDEIKADIEKALSEEDTNTNEPKTQ